MKISTVKRGFEIMSASTTPKEKWCGVVRDEKYMGGVGVLKKTQDLTDEMNAETERLGRVRAGLDQTTNRRYI